MDFDKKKAKAIIYYGIFLIAAGIVGYLSNPAKAKTALISGGTFGTLSLVWGWLALRSVNWSLNAAKATVTFLSVVFTWRAFATWGKVFGGAPEKTFAAALITSMLIASVLLLGVLFKKTNYRTASGGDTLT